MVRVGSGQSLECECEEKLNGNLREMNQMNQIIQMIPEISTSYDPTFSILRDCDGNSVAIMFGILLACLTTGSRPTVS